MKLKSIQFAILIAVCLLTRGTYQEESEATGNKDEISIKDISDDPVETKTELAVDAIPNEKSVETGDTAGADLSAPEPIKEADVIQQATDLLEKNAEKSNVDEVKEPEKVVEAEKQPVDEPLKIKSDQEVEQKEKPLEESEVKEETEAEVAELNQPNPVKQQPEPEQQQQQEEAPKQVGSAESKSDSQSSSETKTDVDYKDEDVQKPAEIRSNVIKDPYEEAKSSVSDKPAEVKSEPVKSGVSVASEQNVVKQPTANEQTEPIVTGEDNKPRSGRINKFFIIIPGTVLVIVIIIVIAFVVYNYKKGYKPVSQDTRSPIYKAADTSAAQV